MARTPSAFIGGPTRETPLPEERWPHPLREDLVIARAGMRTPLLEGADWVAIDGGNPIVDADSIRRRQAPLPAIYDIPGVAGARYRNLLTTSESLVFAASTGFPWINLRGLEDPGDLERARIFLDDSTRLSCTICEPRVLQRSIDEVCELGDALLLDLGALGRKLPPSYCDTLSHAVVKRAREHGTPVLVIPASCAAESTARGAAAERGLVGQLLSAGAHGIVLTAETEHSPRALDAIDLARDLVDRARCAGGRPRSRHSARLGPRDDSGWVRL